MAYNTQKMRLVDALRLKGMEMPVIELEWTIRRGADGKWYAVDTNAETSDGEWHEIVPVPPHRRLIDAYLLKADFTGNFIEAYPTALVHAMIDDAPTIIPAEPAEEV